MRPATVDSDRAGARVSALECVLLDGFGAGHVLSDTWIQHDNVIEPQDEIHFFLGAAVPRAGAQNRDVERVRVRSAGVLRGCESAGIILALNDGAS